MQVNDLRRTCLVTGRRAPMPNVTLPSKSMNPDWTDWLEIGLNQRRNYKAFIASQCFETHVSCPWKAGTHAKSYPTIPINDPILNWLKIGSNQKRNYKAFIASQCIKTHVSCPWKAGTHAKCSAKCYPTILINEPILDWLTENRLKSKRRHCKALIASQYVETHVSCH